LQASLLLCATEDAALDGKFEVLASLFELLEDIDLDRRQNPT